MVIMASSWARTHDGDDGDAVVQHGGHTPNNRLTDMQPWFTVHFLDIGHPCYDQLTPVKTRYPLISISWPCRGSSLQLLEVTCFWSWPLTKCWLSIGSRAHFRLTCWKQGRIARKPVNAIPGLKVHQIVTFSSIQMFFAVFVLCIGWY